MLLHALLSLVVLLTAQQVTANSQYNGYNAVPRQNVYHYYSPAEAYSPYYSQAAQPPPFAYPNGGYPSIPVNVKRPTYREQTALLRDEAPEQQQRIINNVIRIDVAPNQAPSQSTTHVARPKAGVQRITVTKDFDVDKQNFVSHHHQASEQGAKLVKVKTVVAANASTLQNMDRDHFVQQLNQELEQTIPMVLERIDHMGKEEPLKQQVEKVITESISKNIIPTKLDQELTQEVEKDLGTHVGNKKAEKKKPEEEDKTIAKELEKEVEKGVSENSDTDDIAKELEKAIEEAELERLAKTSPPPPPPPIENAPSTEEVLAAVTVPSTLGSEVPAAASTETATESTTEATTQEATTTSESQKPTTVTQEFTTSTPEVEVPGSSMVAETSVTTASAVDTEATSAKSFQEEPETEKVTEESVDYSMQPDMTTPPVEIDYHLDEDNLNKALITGKPASATVIVSEATTPESTALPATSTEAPAFVTEATTEEPATVVSTTESAALPTETQGPPTMSEATEAPIEAAATTESPEEGTSTTKAKEEGTTQAEPTLWPKTEPTSKEEEEEEGGETEAPLPKTVTRVRPTSSIKETTSTKKISELVTEKATETTEQPEETTSAPTEVTEATTAESVTETPELPAFVTEASESTTLKETPETTEASISEAGLEIATVFPQSSTEAPELEATDTATTLEFEEVEMTAASKETESTAEPSNEEVTAASEEGTTTTENPTVSAETTTEAPGIETTEAATSTISMESSTEATSEIASSEAPEEVATTLGETATEPTLVTEPSESATSKKTPQTTEPAAITAIFSEETGLEIATVLPTPAATTVESVETTKSSTVPEEEAETTVATEAATEAPTLEESTEASREPRTEAATREPSTVTQETTSETPEIEVPGSSGVTEVVTEAPQLERSTGIAIVSEVPIPEMETEVSEGTTPSFEEAEVTAASKSDTEAPELESTAMATTLEFEEVEMTAASKETESTAEPSNEEVTATSEEGTTENPIVSAETTTESTPLTEVTGLETTEGFPSEAATSTIPMESSTETTSENEAPEEVATTSEELTSTTETPTVSVAATTETAESTSIAETATQETTEGSTVSQEATISIESSTVPIEEASEITENPTVASEATASTEPSEIAPGTTIAEGEETDAETESTVSEEVTEQPSTLSETQITEATEASTLLLETESTLVISEETTQPATLKTEATESSHVPEFLTKVTEGEATTELPLSNLPFDTFVFETTTPSGEEGSPAPELSVTPSEEATTEAPANRTTEKVEEIVPTKAVEATSAEVEETERPTAEPPEVIVPSKAVEYKSAEETTPLVEITEEPTTTELAETSASTSTEITTIPVEETTAMVETTEMPTTTEVPETVTSTSTEITTVAVEETSSVVETTEALTTSEIPEIPVPTTTARLITTKPIVQQGVCPVANDVADKNRADVLFLVDSSSSIPQEQFQRALKLIADTVQQFKNIGPDGTQVSLVQFNREPFLEFSLRRHNCVTQLLDDIADTPYMNGVSNLGNAIEKVMNYGFSKRRGDRPDAPNVLILVSDGESHDNVKVPMKLIEKENTTVLVISTVEAHPEVLRELAGSDLDKMFHLGEALEKPLHVRLAEKIREVSGIPLITTEVPVTTTPVITIAETESVASTTTPLGANPYDDLTVEQGKTAGQEEVPSAHEEEQATEESKAPETTQAATETAKPEEAQQEATTEAPATEVSAGEEESTTQTASTEEAQTTQESTPEATEVTTEETSATSEALITEQPEASSTVAEEETTVVPTVAEEETAPFASESPRTTESTLETQPEEQPTSLPEQTKIASSETPEIVSHSTVVPTSSGNSELQVKCLPSGFKMNFVLPGSFNGALVVRGHAADNNCRKNVEADPSQKTRNVEFQLFDEKCGLKKIDSVSPSLSESHLLQVEPAGTNFSAVINVLHHRFLVTDQDHGYLVQCFVAKAEEDSDLETYLNVSPDLGFSETISLQSVPPTCNYTLRRDSVNGPIMQSGIIGQTVFHRWECDGGEQANAAYGIQIHDCFAGNDVEHQYPIVDNKGCISDVKLLSPVMYADQSLLAYAQSKVFTVADVERLRFHCKMRLCTRDGDGCEGVTPPQCEQTVQADLLTRLARDEVMSVQQALTSDVGTSIEIRSAQREFTVASAPQIVSEVMFTPEFFLGVVILATLLFIAFVLIPRLCRRSSFKEEVVDLECGSSTASSN
ncbi:hypothetical protein QR680_013679 [Steinernema hermaphroditum]|uniref:VWFA domain-containing protein n=1 Tax=Steinernema hermaphroditum TaxID=289476 RepID=A0AA39I6B2_9BILA|nr:hypothetical protein QR680_013679 [Steinernema hermaphroditum]